MERMMDSRWGTFRILREIVLPAICDSYHDTLAAAHGADLLVGHPLCFATRLVAEKAGIQWASSTHSPTTLFSAHDPPLVPGFPEVSKRLRWLGPMFWSAAYKVLSRASRPWALPLDRLRQDIGLPVAPEVNSLVEGHAPLLHLALFSPRLAAQQVDWPRQTVVTGFPFQDCGGEAGLAPELVKFLDDGPPPLVFTLGRSSATVAGPFFEQSAIAADRLGQRAVLILDDPRNRPSSLPQGVVALDYAPFSALFPRALAIVHHGGVGTMSLAMRSGRPMLVVPRAHDQPDNAARATRLGIARTIQARNYTADRAVVELGRLLNDPRFAVRASEVGADVRNEDGVQVACDALEGLIGGPMS
jgi:UDP:flavonoid glycosyltransferase YjiC (YdhE family)